MMAESLRADDKELVEVGRAHDRFEASIWVRQLQEQGINVSSQKKGSWLRALLYMGRVPYAVSVSPGDHDQALDCLRKNRFL